MKRFKRVLVCELNAGQLVMLLRAKYLIDCESLTKVQGQQFKISDIENKIVEILPDEAVLQ